MTHAMDFAVRMRVCKWIPNCLAISNLVRVRINQNFRTERLLLACRIDFQFARTEFCGMPRTVLVAPDKFKGTLTAAQAAEAIAKGWRGVKPGDRIELLPITDGGDGFGEIISGLLQAEPQTTKTVDAAHRPCTATWWWHTGSRTAIIE